MRVIATGIVLGLCSSAVLAADLPTKTEQALSVASQAQTDRGISAYEPVYFLAGGSVLGHGNISAKFQVSLKYRILNPDKAKEPYWWEQIYLGFTQTSIWDLEADSAPFRDSVYRPSVFFESAHVASFLQSKSLLGLRAGFEHESNGKEKDASRSINMLFVRPVYSFPSTAKGYVWSFAPKLYTYIEKSDNQNIADYRGYIDGAVKLANANDWEATLTLRKGMKSSYGSMQLDVSYPFRGWLRNMNGYFHIQYFNGYGETILDYDRKLPAQVRLGLIVAR